eukprot:scaffold3876_cov22-Tisochrysis_lutea.AAC.4
MISITGSMLASKGISTEGGRLGTIRGPSGISSEGGRLGSQPSTRAPWKLEAGSLESKDLEEV